MNYNSFITPEMQAVEAFLVQEFAGMNHCITNMGRNLIVEVPRTLCETVRTALKRQFQDVTLIQNAYPMMEDLHDFILVKPIITESPIYLEGGVAVPALEKLLVDHDADKEYAALSETDIQKEFQRAFELYPINTSRLLRYAGRKGKKKEVQDRLLQIDQERITIVHKIQDFFCHEPVERAWIFGSFSRMEEKPGSDIDILVDLDHTVQIGLLRFAGMINQLENCLGRKVDLVESSSVKPFALPSINHDKILIYERA